MELILDFGNTRKKLALFDAGHLVLEENHPEISPESLASFLDTHPGITSSILSSVVNHPAAIPELLAARTFFILLDEHTPVPVVNRYETRKTLGKDRLAAAVGGAALFPGKDVLVVNAGTALTFDFVNRRGEYLGGAISPGMQMRFDALHTFTDRLPLVPYREPEGLTGTTTEEAIRSGVVNGMTAEIEGIAAAYREQYTQLQVVLSGGDLNNFVKRLNISIFALPNIVVSGLQKILAFNVHPAR